MHISAIIRRPGLGGSFAVLVLLLTTAAAAPESEPEPTAGEVEPAAAEVKPAAAEVEPAAGEVEPAAGEVEGAATAVEKTGDAEAGAWSPRLHGGLNLRTDVGVHPIRLDGGVQWGPLDAVLVLDPMFWTDGQVNTDLLVQWRGDIGLAIFVGWRLTTVPLLKGPQLQQNLLFGAGADLPRFFGDTIGGQFGLELASTLVKHGGGLPVETIGFASGRHYIDLVNLAFFLRLEVGLGL